MTPTPSPDIIDAVARMQQYILDHLREPITQAQLAQAAGYSHYYSAKIFKELTGTSPFEYMRRLRLTQAAIDLRDQHLRVLDVALDYVFDSHEGFTRAFTKEFGLSPKRYEMQPVPLPYFMPSMVTGYYSLQQNRKKEIDMTEKQTTPAIFVQVVERPARKLIIKRAVSAEDYFAYCEEVGCDVWGILSSIKDALYEPIGMWMPSSLRPENTSLYTQGVEVSADYSGPVPDGFQIIDLPPCKMLIFQGPPYDDEDFMDAIGELWKQTENFDPTIYGYEWADDVAPKFQLAPMGYRGYIEGRPVRPLGKRAF